MPAYIGTCGWSYPHWKEVFYPKGVKPTEWLEYYAQFFQTVEINNTFYYLPKDVTFDNWHDRTPEGFVFSVKASRYITHIQRLVEAIDSLRKFLTASYKLEEKLGAVLFQLAPALKRNDDLLRIFLQDARDRVGRNVRMAFEFRDESWFANEVYQILDDHKACLVFSDWGSLGRMKPVTTDFVYLRRHGPGGDGRRPYSIGDVHQDGRAIKNWVSRGLDVYAYYNNDYAGNAVKNAKELADYVGVEWATHHAIAGGRLFGS